MPKFRPKPVDVDAIRVNEILTAAMDGWRGLSVWVEKAYDQGLLLFASDHVLLDRIRAERGDWILRDTHGALTACKRKDFHSGFEPAPTTPDPAKPPGRANPGLLIVLGDITVRTSQMKLNLKGDPLFLSIQPVDDAGTLLALADLDGPPVWSVDSDLVGVLTPNEKDPLSASFQPNKTRGKVRVTGLVDGDVPYFVDLEFAPGRAVPGGINVSVGQPAPVSPTPAVPAPADGLPVDPKSAA